MAHRTNFWHRCTGLLPILLGVLAVGGLLLWALPASAANPALNGCIQDVWKAPHTVNGVTTQNTQDLTCTANDVRVAQVTNISISSGGSCTGSPWARVRARHVWRFSA